MPPIQKITKEKILNAAFELLRAEGVESLNARTLAKASGCSTQPIFTLYSNMGELRTELFELADQAWRLSCGEIPRDQAFVLNMAIHYVNFALDESHLFRLLFMSEDLANSFLTDFIKVSDEANGVKGRRASLNMELYAHGLATALINKQWSATRLQVREMLSDVFQVLTRIEPEATRTRRKGT